MSRIPRWITRDVVVVQVPICGLALEERIAEVTVVLERHVACWPTDDLVAWYQNAVDEPLVAHDDRLVGRS